MSDKQNFFISMVVNTEECAIYYSDLLTSPVLAQVDAIVHLFDEAKDEPKGFVGFVWDDTKKAITKCYKIESMDKYLVTVPKSEYPEISSANIFKDVVTRKISEGALKGFGNMLDDLLFSVVDGLTDTDEE